MDSFEFCSIRADQNTDGALLEFPMRTVMEGKSRVSSAYLFAIISKISIQGLHTSGGNSVWE